MDELPPLLPSIVAPRARRGGLFLLALVVVVSIGGRIVASPAAHGEYGFLRVNPDGTPVAWDPCHPIHFTLNLELAPAGAEATIHEAIRRVSAATGLTFVDDGFAGVLPDDARSPFRPGSTSEGLWRPVLIGWTLPTATDFMNDDAAAVAWPVAVPAAGGGEVYVTGQIAMNTDYVTGVEFDHPTDWGPILMHELGHLVGLSHVRDRAEIMRPGRNTATDWGPGDVEGLKRLGDGDCRSALT